MEILLDKRGIQMTKPTDAQQTSLNDITDLQQLIDRLKPLHIILSQNSYVKDTTRRLKRIIDDADSQPIFLFLGKALLKVIVDI